MQEQEAQGEDMRIQEIKARKAGKTSSLSPRMRSIWGMHEALSTGTSERGRNLAKGFSQDRAAIFRSK